MDRIAGFAGAGPAHGSCDVVRESTMASPESADQSQRRNDGPRSRHVSRQQHYWKMLAPDARIETEKDDSLRRWDSEGRRARGRANIDDGGSIKERGGSGRSGGKRHWMGH